MTTKHQERLREMVEEWLLNVGCNLSIREIARKKHVNSGNVLRRVRRCEDLTDHPFFGPRLEIMASRFYQASTITNDLAADPLMHELLRGPRGQNTD